MFRSAFLLAAVLAAGIHIHAQGIMRPQQPAFVRTTGEATVSAKPDRAEIDIGVATQAKTAREAVEQNAAAVETTLRRLREVVQTRDAIRTESYSVQPVNEYPRDGGEPKIVGYRATNMVRVTLDDLSLVGRLIDTAAEGGANRIQGLRFTIKDDRPLRSEALRSAARNARAKADDLAAALGVPITRVLSIEESGSVAVPMRDVAFVRASASTPIESGTIDVHASVTLTVAIER